MGKNTRRILQTPLSLLSVTSENLELQSSITNNDKNKFWMIIKNKILNFSK